MKGKFEKDIEQKLNDFKLEPSSQVWQRVEQSLPPERKRRILAWWWIALIGVLISGTILWLRRDEHVSTSFATRVASEKPATQAEGLQPQNAVSSNKTTDSVQQKNNDLNNAPAIADQEITASHLLSQNKAIAANSYNKALIVKRNVPKKISVGEKEIELSTTSPKNEVDIVQEKALALNRQQKQTITSDINNNNVNKDAVNTTTKTDSSDKKISLTSLQKADSTKTSDVKSLPKKTEPKKNQWLLTASVGTLNIKSSFFKQTNANTQAFAVAPGGGAGAPGTAAPVTPITDPTQGFSLSLGAMYEMKLDKRWIFDAGLQYRYLQNKQSVGQDSITNINSMLINFYAGGSNSTAKNYAHIIELPVRIQFSLNPSSKNQLRLFAGAALGVVLSEKWLITNKDISRYYYDATAKRSVAFSVNAGLLFDHNNKWQIALLADKSLTSIHANTSDFSAWQQYSLQFIKPFSFKRK